MLVALGVLQLAIAFLLDLPRWFADPGRNPDLFSGTFGESPYQMVFFLLVIVGLLGGIFTFEKRRSIARLTPVLLVAIFVVTFLAQYRALLLTMALTIILLALLLARQSARGVVGATLALVALVGTLVYAAQYIPTFKFQATIQDSGGDPTFYLKQRLKTIDPVEQLFGDTPGFTIIGTGPGTFSSRAWRTFAVTPDSTTDVTNKYTQKLTGGRPYHTDVSDKYLLPELRTAAVISGSHAITSPFWSYLSLIAEVGVPGFALIVGIYVWAFMRSLKMARVAIRKAEPGDPLPALLCASLVAFFALLQMAALDNWLEVTRITFITWMLFAVVTKEFNARGLDDDGPDQAVLAT
jgi:O-antigen ligase